MTSEKRIHGIHHITAVTSSAAENRRFYEDVLGLRLVKQTVNFDDPYTYHLYYGDGSGTPGTIITFFPWEGLPPGRPGAGMVTAVNFGIPRKSVDFWLRRLQTHGVATATVERFGEPVVQLSDPHGLPVELTGTDTPAVTTYWRKGPVGAGDAISGFHSATAILRQLEPARDLLTGVMGMRPVDREGGRHRFAMLKVDLPGHFYDLVVDPQAPAARPGSGTVHHIAFRTENDASQTSWRSALNAAGIAVTPVRDRKYFRSIYFDTPEGVLFEIATDPPGFAIDEPMDRLGTALKLPDPLEPMRPDIEKRLPPLISPGYRHLFRRPEDATDSGHTLVTLHGTGGSEHDLVPMAAALSPGSAIISPRGDVRENGMPRFFKRLANNLFDETDLVRRAGALAAFIASAALDYDRDPRRLTALGYSNGANMAAALLLLSPDVLSSAVLIRPMLPLQKPVLPDLNGKQILILRGDRDTVIPARSTDQLEAVLAEAGAQITALRVDAGHEITPADLEAIAQWLVSVKAAGPQDVSDPETLVTV